MAHWVENLQTILDHIPDPGFARTIAEHIARIHPEYQPGMIKLKRTGKKFWVGIGLHCPATATAQEVHAITKDIRQALFKDLNLIGDADFFIE